MLVHHNDNTNRSAHDMKDAKALLQVVVGVLLFMRVGVENTVGVPPAIVENTVGSHSHSNQNSHLHSNYSHDFL